MSGRRAPTRVLPRGVRGDIGSCDGVVKDGARLLKLLVAVRLHRGLSAPSAAPNERGLFGAIGEVADLDPLLRGVPMLKISEPSAANSLEMSVPVAFKGEDLGSSNLKDSGIPMRVGRRRGVSENLISAATGDEIGALAEADDAWVDALRPHGRCWHFVEGVVGASAVILAALVDGRLEFISFGAEGGSGVKLGTAATVDALMSSAAN